MLLPIKQKASIKIKLSIRSVLKGFFMSKLCIPIKMILTYLNQKLGGFLMILKLTPRQTFNKKRITKILATKKWKTKNEILPNC